MFQSTAEAKAPVAGPAVQPSFAEQLTAFGHDAWKHLLQLDASEAGLNLLVTTAIVLLAIGLLWLLRRVFDHWLARFAARSPGDAPQDEKRTPKVAGVTWLLLRLAVLVATLAVVAAVWGVDPWTWVSGEAGGRLIRLTLIVVLVTALVEMAGHLIRRTVEGFAQRSGDARRAAQLRTLGPILTGSVQTVLVAIGLLTFLSEVGVKVGPLLASAGVVGIAIGFGAQTLVKDFLTGLFLIVEDVVSVGDNVRIGESSGTVEAMTLRTIRLRSMNGTLHVFPYSEAQVIHNRTKAFSSYLFEIQISYDSDIDQAMAVMAAVGEEMRADPEFGPSIIKPFEVMGVDKLADSGVVLKARVTTQPRGQWIVGREFNRRIKLAFDAHGVGIPFPTIQIAPPKADAAGENTPDPAPRGGVD